LEVEEKDEKDADDVIREDHNANRKKNIIVKKISLREQAHNSHNSRHLNTNIISILIVIDQNRWWDSVHDLPLSHKLTDLLENTGIEFWENSEKTLAKPRPVIALCAVGGIPLRIDDSGGVNEKERVYFDFKIMEDIENKDSSTYYFFLAVLSSAFKSQMACGSFPSYLNSKKSLPKKYV